MATVERIRSERRFVLRGVSWQTYSALRDAPGNDNVRMTYDRGVLEMMSPSRLHERFGYVIGRLIDVWTLELGIPIQSCGSMTCRREDLARGFEPDRCYYVENEPLVWNRETLDLSVDPPPDLAVEIDLTRSAVAKTPLYAAFAVPEIWCFDGQDLRVYLLGPDGNYSPSDRSRCFPQLPPSRVEDCARQAAGSHETELIRSFQEWIRAEILPGDS